MTSPLFWIRKVQNGNRTKTPTHLYTYRPIKSNVSPPWSRPMDDRIRLVSYYVTYGKLRNFTKNIYKKRGPINFPLYLFWTEVHTLRNTETTQLSS